MVILEKRKIFIAVATIFKFVLFAYLTMLHVNVVIINIHVFIHILKYYKV